MKNKKNIFIVLLILLFSFFLTGCPDKEEKEPELTEQEKADLKLKEDFNKEDLFLFSGDSDAENVYSPFILVGTWQTYKVYWESNNEVLKIVDNLVATPTLGDEDVVVTLKATVIIRSDFFIEREINVIVKKQKPFIFHIITLDLNGGDYSHKDFLYVQELSKVDIKGDPTKVGHRFIGWTKNGEPYDLNERVTESFTLVAQYERLDIPDRIVYLDINGANVFDSPKSYLVELNGLFTLPTEEPYKHGYAFIGWTLNGELFDPLTPINEDITLVAQYAKRHEVVFILKGGVIINGEREDFLIYVNDGEYLDPNMGAPVKYGYTFNGWYEYPNGGALYYDRPVTRDMTLVAYYDFNPEQIGEEEIKPLLISRYANNTYSQGDTIDLINIYEEFDRKLFTISWTTDPVDLLDTNGVVNSTYSGNATLHATIKYQSYTGELQIPIKIVANVVPPPDYGDYYNSITATSGDILVNQLQTLITGSLGVNGEGNITYGEVRYLLETSDLDLNTPNKLWGIYDGVLVNNVWDKGATWDREHVWPQSRLNSSAGNARRNIASDPHNLRACVPSTNLNRGNKFFVQGTGANGLVGSGYYPGDEHKGDVARILLYMAVRYRGLLTLVDVQRGSNKTPEGANLATLSVLMNWHLEDLPDEFERQRNNVIQAAQGNRNPFIDKPNYFRPVWELLMAEENLTISQTLAFNNTIKTYDILKTTYIPIENRYTI